MVEMESRLGNLLRQAGTSEGGIVILCPPEVPTGFMANPMALAPGQAEAEDLARRARDHLGIADASSADGRARSPPSGSIRLRSGRMRFHDPLPITAHKERPP